MKETKEKITYDKLIAEIRTILNNDWKMTDKNNIIQGENDIYVLMEVDQNSKKSSVMFCNEKYKYENIAKMQKEYEENKSVIQQWLEYVGLVDGEFDVEPDYSLVKIQFQIKNIMNKYSNCEMSWCFHRADKGSFVFVDILEE